MSDRLGDILKKRVDRLKGTDIIEEMPEARIYSPLFNTSRSDIFERITFMPGITISTLSYLTHLAPTSVKWHLQKLIESSYIHVERMSKKKAVFAVEQILDEDHAIFHAINQSSTSRLIFTTVCANPGIAMDRLTEKLEMSYQAVRWHTGYLEKAGVIESLRDGRHRRFFPSELWKMKREEFNREEAFKRYLLKRFKEEKLDPEILPSHEKILSVRFRMGEESYQIRVLLNPYFIELS